MRFELRLSDLYAQIYGNFFVNDSEYRIFYLNNLFKRHAVLTLIFCFQVSVFHNGLVVHTKNVSATTALFDGLMSATRYVINLTSFPSSGHGVDSVPIVAYTCMLN